MSCNKLTAKNKRKKTDLSKLDRSELENKIEQLEAHVLQLKNIIAKRETTKQDFRFDPVQLSGKKPFDFKRFKQRHVALKILYMGWNYQGFATQEDTFNTIEAELFRALMMSKIIESRENSNYHRCGRTDKGVSAFSQVISLDVRTNLLEGEGVFEPKGYSPNTKNNDERKEIDYPQILNRILPPEIRVLAWSPVPVKFSARFDCIQRTYRYYIPKGNLNIELMRSAGNYLVGEHDFRNLCKMDVGNGVVNYHRKIVQITIDPSDFVQEKNGYEMFVLKVVGSGFLWHQIRCIVAILLLVGQGLEQPEIMLELLDVDKITCKPQYSMASELPLVLFDCQFENLEWNYELSVLESVIRTLQGQWTESAIKTETIRNMLNEIESVPLINSFEFNEQSRSLLMGVKSKVYKPLLQRPGCDSLESRIEHWQKRRKLDTN